MIFGFVQWHIKTIQLVVLFFLIVILLNFVASSVVAWLDQKHKWDAKKSNNNTNLHALCLGWHEVTPLWLASFHFIEDTTTKEHDNHSHDNSWWLFVVFGELMVPVSEPFSNDHVVHESEESSEHNELSDTFENDINPFPVVEEVADPEASTEKHLGHAIHDCRLHLKVIEVHNFLCASHPSVVETEWIHAIFVWSNSINCWFFRGFGIFNCFLCWHFPASVSDHNWQRTEIVVDETAVEGEESHHEEQIFDGCQLVSQRAFLCLCHNQIETEDGKQGTMHDISKHNTK